jgi:hypothetical protein
MIHTATFTHGLELGNQPLAFKSRLLYSCFYSLRRLESLEYRVYDQSLASNVRALLRWVIQYVGCFQNLVLGAHF